MNTRNLTVRYATEGFAGAIDSLRQVGQAFDKALATSQQAAAEAANAAKDAFDPEEVEKANQELVRSVTKANQIIQNSYRSLGVKQEASVNQQKEQAVAAFNAIKNSGVASANDIARAQVALDRRLRQLDASLEVVEEQTKKTAGGFTVLKGVVANLASGAITNGIQSISRGVRDLIGNVIEAGTTAERQAVSFETFLGSKEKATKVLTDIRNFAATTQFQLPEVTDAGKQLLAAGFEAEEIIPTLKMVAEVATAADKPLSQVLFIYAQIKNQGKAMAGDINQLYNAGLGAKDFAKALNISEEAVKSLASKGEIGFAEVKKVFESLTQEGGRFYGLIDKLSDTTGTKLSNLEDAFGAIYRTIYESVEPAISSMLDVIVGTIAPLGENKDLWSGLNEEALGFQQYIKENPSLTKALGDQLQASVAVVMKGIVASAKQFLNYLEQNPDAIAEAVGRMGSLLVAAEKFVKLIAKAIDGWREIAMLIDRVTGRFEQSAALSLGRDNDITKEDVRQEFIRQKGFDPFAPGAAIAVKSGTLGQVNIDELITEVVQDLIIKKAQAARYGPQQPEVYGPPVPNKNLLPVPAKAVANVPSTGSLPAPPPSDPDPSAPTGSASSPTTKEQQFAAKTIAIAKELKIDPQALMTIMLFESKGTLSPKIQGPEVIDKKGRSQGKGRGLIQFMPSTARGLGASDAALAGMTQLEQLDWVKKYFAQFKGNFGAGKLENLYAAVLAGDPQKVNASDGYTTARQGAVRMQREYGSKAASLLGAVPQGADLSSQYEFETETANREELLLQEKRRQEEDARKSKQERLEQQQKLDLSALDRKNGEALKQFDADSLTLPPEQKEAREVLRAEKERELELAEKLLEIEQQISNLRTERDYKVKDKAAGYPVTNRDITAEIQELEAQKQFAIAGVARENAAARKEFGGGLDSKDNIDLSKELVFEVGSLYRSELDTALSDIDERYRGYLQSIGEAIANLKTTIENKKLLGEDTKLEEEAILTLEKTGALIPQYRATESRKLRRDDRRQREIDQLASERQGLEYDASINEGKAAFADRLGFGFAANKLRRDSAIALENNRFKQELLELLKLEKTYEDQPKKLEELKAKASELNEVNLDGINQQFKSLSQTVEDSFVTSTQGFFANLTTNFFDGKAARNQDLLQERLRYAEEVVGLENQYREEPGKLAYLKNRARELNEQSLSKISGEFSIFGRAVDLAKQALLEFIKQLAAMAAQQAAAKFISSIIGGALGGASGSAAQVGNDYGSGAGGVSAFIADEGATVGERRLNPSLTNWLRANSPGVAQAWNAEGADAQLGVFHTGEELLSRKTGEAGRYQALKARYGVNPLDKIGVFASGGTVGDVNTSILASMPYRNPRIDLSGLNQGRSQKAEVRRSVTIHQTVVTPNADSFRLNSDQLNQDLVESMRRGM